MIQIGPNTMSSDAEITLWLGQLKVGDRDGVRQLMEAYFQRLVQLASSRLKGRSALAGYEEDVALSAFKSVCLGVQQGKFSKLDNRDDLCGCLWCLRYVSQST